MRKSYTMFLLLLFGCQSEIKKVVIPKKKEVKKEEISISEKLGIEQIRRMDSLHSIGKFD